MGGDVPGHVEEVRGPPKCEAVKLDDNVQEKRVVWETCVVCYSFFNLCWAFIVPDIGEELWSSNRQNPLFSWSLHSRTGILTLNMTLE